MSKEIEKRLAKALERSEAFRDLTCDSPHIGFMTREEIERNSDARCIKCGAKILVVESPISTVGYYDQENRFWFDDYVAAFQGDNEVFIRSKIVELARQLRKEKEEYPNEFELS